MEQKEIQYILMKMVVWYNTLCINYRIAVWAVVEEQGKGSCTLAGTGHRADCWVLALKA